MKILPCPKLRLRAVKSIVSKQELFEIILCVVNFLISAPSRCCQIMATLSSCPSGSVDKKQKFFVLFPIFTMMRQFSVIFLPIPNEVWGKVMFLHLSVILFTGCGVHPLGRHFPLGRHPRGQRPPNRHTRADTPPGRHPLGRHPPPNPKTETEAGGTHPVDMTGVLFSVPITAHLVRSIFAERSASWMCQIC